MKNNKLLLLLFTLSLFVQIPETNAATLFDTTDGNIVFSTSAGWLVRDYRPSWNSSTQFAAMSFSLSSDSIVTGADLALTSLASWSRNYSIQILEDNGGLPSDNIAGEFTTLARPPIHTGASTVDYTSVSGAEINLLAQTTYWLYLFCYADCELYWWRDESNPIIGANQVNSTFPYDLRWHSSGNPAAMFRITGTSTVVPLPPSLFLFVTGLFGLVSITRKKATQ